jgi:hypothetical protein
MMTMAEIQHTLADLVKFSSEQKPLEFGSAFSSLIAPKIDSAINTKKIEVAHSMFNNDDSESDESDDSEAGDEDAEVA